MESLGPSQRNTLLLFMYDLVHHHYRYDPEKNTDHVKTIKATLSAMGIKLSDDIIRAC